MIPKNSIFQFYSLPPQSRLLGGSTLTVQYIPCTFPLRRPCSNCNSAEYPYSAALALSEQWPNCRERIALAQCGNLAVTNGCDMQALALSWSQLCVSPNAFLCWWRTTQYTGGHRVRKLSCISFRVYNLSFFVVRGAFVSNTSGYP